MSIRSKPARSRDLAAIDALEPRSLFSAPFEFVSVGIRYDEGPSAFFVHGSIAGDDSITGNMQFATLASVSGPNEPIDWTRYNRGTGTGVSSFTFDTRGGFTPYASQIGTRFIEEERRDIGSFVGRDGDGAVRDYAVFMQSDSSIDGTGAFSFGMNNRVVLQMTRLITGGETEVVSVTIDPVLQNGFPTGGLNFTYQLSSGTVTAMRQITGFENGAAILDGGERLIMNVSRDVLFTDFDNDDGIVGIASGHLESRASQSRTENGVYRGSVVVTGPASAAFFGVDPADLGADGTAVADIVIHLQLRTNAPESPLNVFRIYRQSEYDTGMRTPVNNGAWRAIFTGADFPDVGFTRLQLTSVGESFIFLRFSERTGAANRSLHFEELFTPLDAHEELAGVASGSSGALLGNFTEHLGAVEDGRPVAYLDIRATNEAFVERQYRVDLIDNAGGEAVVGELITWIGRDSRAYWAGVSASGAVQVWRYAPEMGFTYANLSTDVEGGRTIASELFFTNYATESLLGDSWQHQVLAGFDSDGHFVVFQQNFMFNEFDPDAVWDFRDASAEGFGDSGTLPEFTSDLVGWRSGWGGAHFAGLDSEGQIWSVWWTPSLAQWQVSNVSGSAGEAAVPLVGNLSVLRTTWDTFHLNGTDADGNLISTWWAPGFDSWHTENLTDQFDGPALAAGTLTSNFSIGLQNINIVGADEDGQVRVYWWNAGVGWHVNTLSGSVAPSSIPLQPWHMTSSTWLESGQPPARFAHSQSLLGHNDDGDLVRLVWRSYGDDEWVLDNITQNNEPYFL